MLAPSRSAGDYAWNFLGCRGDCAYLSGCVWSAFRNLEPFLLWDTKARWRHRVHRATPRICKLFHYSCVTFMFPNCQHATVCCMWLGRDMSWRKLKLVQFYDHDTVIGRWEAEMHAHIYRIVLELRRSQLLEQKAEMAIWMQVPETSAGDRPARKWLL